MKNGPKHGIELDFNYKFDIFYIGYLKKRWKLKLIVGNNFTYI